MKHHLKVPSIPRQEATVSILEKDILLVGSKGTARPGDTVQATDSVRLQFRFDDSEARLRV